MKFIYFKIIILIVLPIFLMTSCSVRVDSENAQKRLEQRKQLLSNYFENKSLLNWKDDYDNEEESWTSSCSFNYKDSTTYTFEIYLTYNIFNKELCYFTIYYDEIGIKKNNIYKNINIKELCEIANVLSKKEITEDTIEKALYDAPNIADDNNVSNIISKRSELSFLSDDYVFSYCYDKFESEMVMLYCKCI